MRDDVVAFMPGPVGDVEFIMESIARWVERICAGCGLWYGIKQDTTLQAFLRIFDAGVDSRKIGTQKAAAGVAAIEVKYAGCRGIAYITVAIGEVEVEQHGIEVHPHRIHRKEGIKRYLWYL